MVNQPERKGEVINTPQREAQNIASAAQGDAGFEKMLKVKKGEYYCDGEEVAMGKEYTAHAVGWTKCWIKFRGGMVQERKIYRMINGEQPPDRDRLDDQDNSKWEMGINGLPADPWVLQYLLPMEDKGGELVIFVTSSFGGKRAIADLCSAWGRKAAKQPGCGQPIVKLRKLLMPTKKFGDVPRPYFEITGWDDVREGIRDPNVPDSGPTMAEEMNDEIPF
jgi:hypothetical protein